MFLPILDFFPLCNIKTHQPKLQLPKPYLILQSQLSSELLFKNWNRKGMKLKEKGEHKEHKHFGKLIKNRPDAKDAF